MSADVDVLAIGHLDKGRVVMGGVVQSIAGGAIHFGGMVLLALGLRVGVLTRLAREDVELLADLRQAGARLYLVFTGETSAIENVLPNPSSDQRRCFQKGFAGTFRAEDLPDVRARLYYVGTIVPDEVDLAFLQAVAARGPLALDAQGCIRQCVGNELITVGWPWAEQALPLVRYLKVDDREALALTGEEDHHRAAGRLAAWGPREIVLTHQEGVLVLAEGRFYDAPFRPRPGSPTPTGRCPFSSSCPKCPPPWTNSPTGSRMPYAGGVERW